MFELYPEPVPEATEVPGGEIASSSDESSGQGGSAFSSAISVIV